MAPETWMPADERERGQDAAEIDRLQMEAAESAHNVGAFQHFFRAHMEHAVENGEVEEAAAQRRLEAVDTATSKHADVRLDTTEAGVLGYNRIGAGTSGMRLSRATFAAIRTGTESADIRQTVAHEAAHGRQVQLEGTLEMDGKEIDPLLLYEGHAEIASNAAVGTSEHAHRAGQPREVYAEGQEVALAIIRRTSRASFERALTGDGDLSRLQRELDRTEEPAYALAA